MRRLIILFILLANIFVVFALCEEGQININTASVEELQEIKWVGETIAGNIIYYRSSSSFESVDDLIYVSRIGDITLSKIKNQTTLDGNFLLVCVSEKEINEEVVEEELEILEETIEEEQDGQEIIEEKKEEKPIPEVIKLTPKSIKTEDNKKELSKENYVKYGFVIFCILLGFLFILKGKTNKNEFD